MGFVEGQPQKISKRTLINCYSDVIIMCTLNTRCNKSVTSYYVR